jgi:N-methylhydantoinase B/oxoprolinase/acetone carboxylase alpha subunit
MGGRDFEILSRTKTEPATEEELRCMELLSPADFEIFSHQMQMIALEANEVLIKTAGTPAGLAGDIGSCVYSAQGDPAAAAVGIWAHAFAGQLPIKYILKHWQDDPSVGIRDGDAFFCNEALYGGVHPPDCATFLPIFYEGELIAWAETMAHTTDTGAVEMGGISLSAESRYEEGMKFSPIKVAENFLLKEDIVTLMENFVRDPRVITLDNKARMAACMRIRQRVLEVVEKKGVDFVVGGLRKMIAEGSKIAKERLSKLNDGIYRQPVFLNCEDLEARGGKQIILRMMVAMHKEGDHVTVKFDGTSPEQPFSLNAYSHVIHPYGTGYICCSHLFPDLPPSIGLLEAFDVEIPEGTFINPSEEAAVGASPVSTFIAAQAIFPCLAKMLFDSEIRSNIVSTYPYMTLYVVWGGLDRRGNYYVGIGGDINAGGFPARWDKDGVNTGGFFVATRSDCEDVENIDIIASMSYLFRRHGQDNFGHGKYRGGAGIEMAYMAHKLPMIVIMSVGGCGKFVSAPGIFGGYGSPPLLGVKVEGTNLAEMLAEGDENVPTSFNELLRRRDVIEGEGRYTIRSAMCELGALNEGDIFATFQGGGGGYGDVLERDPEAVIKDVKEELVSHWAASNVYKVSYDPDTFVIDTQKTTEMRDDERQDRKRRGLRYDEFEEEWLKQRPPQEALEHYGSWPDGM